MHTIIPIDQAPKLEYVDLPILPRGFAELVREKRIELGARKDRWDGDILGVVSVTRDRIKVARMTYAYALALNEIAAGLHQISGVPLIGSLGVHAFIRDRDGNVVWAKRADNKRWSFSFGGFAEPGLSPEEVLETEADEELGLDVKSLRCAPAQIAINKSRSFVAILYACDSSESDPTAQCTLGKEEVLELQVIPPGNVVDGDVEPLAEAALNAFGDPNCDSR